jgi:hypothetical protein
LILKQTTTTAQTRPLRQLSRSHLHVGKGTHHSLLKKWHYQQHHHYYYWELRERQSLYPYCQLYPLRLMPLYTTKKAKAELRHETCAGCVPLHPQEPTH